MIASNAARWSIRRGLRFGGSYSATIGTISAYRSSEARQMGGSGGRCFFGRPVLHLQPASAAELMPV
jgi:hypothetical protein